MKNLLILFGILSLLVLPLSSSGADLVSADEKKGNVIIDWGTKNLYTAGSIVLINADVSKDVYAAGNVINLNSDVAGNFNASGGTITLDGNIGGSVHVAGGTILIKGNIADDLFITAKEVVIARSASIGGDLIVGAGTISIQGPIKGNIRLAGGEVSIDSSVGGDVYLKSEGLELGSNALISGGLYYTSLKEVETSGKVLGEITYNRKKNFEKQFFTIGFIIKMLGIMAAGLVFVYLLKKFSSEVVKKGLDNFWTNAGIGLGILILTPIISILLMVSIVGLWLAFLVLVTYLFLILIAVVLSSIIFGVWLMRVLGKNKKRHADWQSIVVGVITLSLIVFIPFFGPFIGFILLLISLGALAQWFYKLTV